VSVVASIARFCVEECHPGRKCISCAFSEFVPRVAEHLTASQLSMVAARMANLPKHIHKDHDAHQRASVSQRDAARMANMGQGARTDLARQRAMSQRNAARVVNFDEWKRSRNL
jgi:hypothetical protein